MRTSNTVKKYQRGEPIILDDYTFGNSEAEITLAKILTQKNKPWLVKDVSKALSRCTTHLRNITFINNKLNTRVFLFHILEAQYNAYLEGSRLAHEPDVLSFTKNCIHKRLMQFVTNYE